MHALKDRDPTQDATRWLADFSQALAAGDTAAALALFADECYWRDMVAFTWNIKTMEGKDEIAELLRATRHAGAAGNFRIQATASDNDELTEAWFTFETGVARGQGHLRLQEGQCPPCSPS